ncbi:hypothetical protein FACS1894208_00130 [Clostridia bacterium]|nr:hypothetical protein FACS1894208_00130 [Clostridia bacterium]
MTRVTDSEGLRSALAQVDVLITDTPFDASVYKARRCIVLRTLESASFAKANGFDCVDAADIPEWFRTKAGVDVSRRARGTVAEAEPTARVSQGVSRYEALYGGLVDELRKSPDYAGLTITDGKTYDILLQTMRGTLRKAGAISTDMQVTISRLTAVEADLAQALAGGKMLDEDVAVILTGLCKAVEECDRVLNVIAGMSSDPALIEYGEVAVKAKAALGLSQKFTSASDARELRALGSVIREYLACQATIVTDLARIGAGSVKLAADARQQSHNAAMAKAIAERSAAQATSLLEQERQNSVNLAQQLTGVQERLNQQIQLTTDAENKLILSGGQDVPALHAQMRELRRALQEKDEQIRRTADMTSEPNSDAAVGDLSPEVATGIIRQLRSQVASLKLERDRATAGLMKAKTDAAREGERAELLSINAKSLSQVALRGSQVSALPLFNYSAKALIIPVFGNGSTGISSSAVSLAKLLGVNARTVLVDFDLVATDLEGRVGTRINPLVAMDGVDKNSAKSTAMGLFVERGKDFFASHFSELVVRVDSNKAGILDYLPGFYAKPDLFNLTQADYPAFLNYLGSRYDYIVIDAGKIGCSEIGDQILRNLLMCAFRSLIVTDASVEKARAMRLKLNDVLGTELRNVIGRSVWLTNRATRNEDLTRYTAPSIGVTLPILPEMVGAHQSFHITHGAQKDFNKVVRALSGV